MKQRLTNQIWDVLMKDKRYERNKLNYLEVNEKDYNKLIDEFSQEFETHEADRLQLETYFGLKISIGNNEQFRIS